MKAKVWFISILATSAVLLGTAAFTVYRVDPYFHFHKPLTDRYYYELDNQRSQNDGILRSFDYDALITGTSMTENFKTSEAERLFGGKFVKVPYSGATYREINECVEKALKENPGLKTVIRGLDMVRFLDAKDLMRTDLGSYPFYLYDDDPFNDVEYLFNRDILFGTVWEMIQNTKEEGFEPGITSFDDYSRWQDDYVFGKASVFPDGVHVEKTPVFVHLTEEEKAVIRGNIEANIISAAEAHPDVVFYCFYSPYSIGWWNDIRNDGTLLKQLEAERCITELLIKHKNIRLYSFNNMTDITTDLNNYKDIHHYSDRINSLMLECMSRGECLLTEDNYMSYLEKEYAFYTGFDYSSLLDQ